MLNIYNYIPFCGCFLIVFGKELYDFKYSQLIQRIIQFQVFISIYCPVGGGCRIDRLLLCRVVKPGVVAPDLVLYIGQIKLKCVLMLN